MADNQNRENQSNRSDMPNQGSNQNINTGRENDLKNPDEAFNNPQDGEAWDNYRSRSFSSNPQGDEGSGSRSNTSNTGNSSSNTGNTGSGNSSNQNR